MHQNPPESMMTQQKPTRTHQNQPTRTPPAPTRTHQNRPTQGFLWWVPVVFGWVWMVRVVSDVFWWVIQRISSG
jgi:hypothetical protein